MVIRKADITLSDYALDGSKPASQMRAPSLNAITEALPRPRRKAMRRCVHSYRKLAVGLLAAAGVVGLTARAILAQSNPPGPAASTQDEPIKRTVLYRGDLEGAPGKEIVVFVADLAPGAEGSKHYHPGPEFFYVLEGMLAHEPEGGSRWYLGGLVPGPMFVMSKFPLAVDVLDNATWADVFRAHRIR